MSTSTELAAKLKTKEQLQEVLLSRYVDVLHRVRIAHIVRTMVFNQVESFLRIDLVDFATNIHLPKNLIDSAHLLINVSEDRRTVEFAADAAVPIAALLPKNVLVAVDD